MTKKIKTKKGKRIYIDDGDEDEEFVPAHEDGKDCAVDNFWKVVDTKKRTYTPEELWNRAVDYFNWCKDNPLYELKVFGVGSSKKVPHPRAMTEAAFCLFAGISSELFLKWKKGQRGKDADGEAMYVEVTKAISTVIYQQKFTGAAAGFLNANIISRELGLAERTINDNKNYNSVPLDVSEIKEISQELDKLIL